MSQALHLQEPRLAVPVRVLLFGDFDCEAEVREPCIAVSAGKPHARALFFRLAVRNRRQTVALATERGLLTSADAAAELPGLATA